MAPFLESSFADVPITDAGVDTLAFLEASEGLARLFDLLGSAAFSVVQSDLRGNIELIENEKGEKKRTATEGLMWLLRGLSFTCKGLQNAQNNKSEDLSTAFRRGYDVTLKKYHNFIVQGVFSVAMNACPHRVDFYNKLAADPAGGASMPEDKLNEELNKWLSSLEHIVTRVEAFYEKGGYSKGL
ncbi:glycolipid transfer protein [Neolentinus lepideus HHB14362 ss-1]|uniref:Glycolipid transfer protein n=1 Tax=Neolentinus lepideus HHB14362 ss-1 TaxID=1314782 RepID=A0A165SQ01_9AGAM|nr:glycolipid transfer protein [Neolentinus lepideus HHB14362 ss-1]